MGPRDLGIVLADVSGTTRLYRKIGTGEAERALERCLRRIERVIVTHRGRLAKPATDELVALFDDADNAAQAAIEMQLRIGDLPPVSGVKLSIRVGLHFGVVELASGEPRGSAADTARLLLGIAGPHQILTCARTAEAMTPPLRQLLRSLDDMAIPGPEGDMQLYELTWFAESVPPASAGPPTLPGNGDAPASRPASARRVAGERFCIRFAGKAYLVDAKTPSLTIGRDKTCDVVIGGLKASRVHLRIEKRDGGRFFLVDLSSNGTFVTAGKTPEIRLRGEEIELAGRGRIAFGHSSTSPEAEIAEFEVL